MDKKNTLVIGLFGTCDNIKWRDPFMSQYDELGISYFNPMVDDWHPGLIEEENFMLNNAEVILFPVLADSLGSGSLGEIGFSVSNVIRNIANGKNQCLIALIDDDCNPVKEATKAQIERSIKDRKLVKSKLIEKTSYPNIVLVDTLQEMFDLSLKLHKLMKEARTYQDEKTGTTG